MTFSGRSWIFLFLTPNFRVTAVLEGANVDLSFPDFTPSGFDSAGQMLKIIVLEKDALQEIDDQIDGSAGNIPDLPVVGSSGGDDLNLHMGLFPLNRLPPERDCVTEMGSGELGQQLHPH